MFSSAVYRPKPINVNLRAWLGDSLERISSSNPFFVVNAPGPMDEPGLYTVLMGIAYAGEDPRPGGQRAEIFVEQMLAKQGHSTRPMGYWVDAIERAITVRVTEDSQGLLMLEVECHDPRAEDYCKRLVGKLGEHPKARRVDGDGTEWSSTTRRTRQGASRNEERDDWPEKLRHLTEWERSTQAGENKELAARRIAGVGARTMERWKNRRDNK